MAGVGIDTNIWQPVGATYEINEWEFANAVSVEEYRNAAIGQTLLHLKTLIAQVEEEPIDASDPEEIVEEIIYIPNTWWDHLKITLYDKYRFFRPRKIRLVEIVKQVRVVKTLTQYRNCPHVLKEDLEKHIEFLAGEASNGSE